MLKRYLEIRRVGTWARWLGINERDQPLGVARRGAEGVVVEVDVHVTPLFAPAADLFSPALELPGVVARGVGDSVAVQADVDQVRGHGVPQRPVGGVGLAHRDAKFAQAVGDLGVEPGFVAELDRVPRPLPAPQRPRKPSSRSMCLWKLCGSCHTTTASLFPRPEARSRSMRMAGSGSASFLLCVRKRLPLIANRKENWGQSTVFSNIRLPHRT